MEIRPIHTDADHQEALRRMEALWDAKEGTREFEQLDVLATLVDAYERKRWPIVKPDPLQALLFRMEQLHLTKRDLEPILGASRPRVFEILNRRRRFSLAMIRALNEKLEIPADVLISKYKLKATRRSKVRHKKARVAIKRAG